MRAAISVAVVLTAALLLPAFAVADPPSHAPAHGYRAKQKQTQKEGKDRTPASREGGVEVVFDSERGIEIAVGFPDVFFHGGVYYRLRNGRWQISATGDGEWRFSASSEIPALVVEAGSKKSIPGPAKRKPGKNR